MKKVIALCLVAVLLLGGCAKVDFAGYFDQLSYFFGDTGGAGGESGGKSKGGSEVYTDPTTDYKDIRFEDITYYRPDMDELTGILEESCAIAESSEDISEVEDAILEYYWIYDEFYTSYFLANIYYCLDMTDTYWQEEYSFCEENSTAADAGLEVLYYALAKSPIRDELEGERYFGEGFFDYYEGESIWDDTFVGMMEQESELINEYYAILSEATDVEYYSEEFFSTYGDRLGQLLVELIALRQNMAAYVGYDSYPQFAYDFYYYRDYTPEEALALAEDIRRELAPLYGSVNSSSYWGEGYLYCSEYDNYAYVRSCAEAMGGDVADAFQAMDEGGFFDITYSEKKSTGSFTVYLNSYYMPYVFVGAAEINYDKLSFAHEFGHFVNDYCCYGSYSGIDVAEVFSQGMEYLSLCYAEDEAALERFKLVDGLAAFVEQSAYATFEQKMYDLKGDDLTVENLAALYEDICTSYQLDRYNWDSRDFVTIEHFYTNPMYVISYVVSNDVAFQLYQLEKEDPGAGLDVYLDNIDSEESYIVYFAEGIGLESPFAQGRAADIRQSLEEMLQ